MLLWIKLIFWFQRFCRGFVGFIKPSRRLIHNFFSCAHTKFYVVMMIKHGVVVYLVVSWTGVNSRLAGSINNYSLFQPKWSVYCKLSTVSDLVHLLRIVILSKVVRQLWQIWEIILVGPVLLLISLFDYLLSLSIELCSIIK